jgi:hypothetical protein
LLVAEAGAPRVVASGHLRSSPLSLERNVTETFRIEDRGCETVFVGRQEWPIQSADFEVIYDEHKVPIRVWKRMTVPGAKRADGYADIRRYELRTPEVTITRHTADGQTKYEILKPGGKTTVAAGAKPVAVVGPGRGVLTMWIQRAKLSVGERVRELVLDFREMVELLEEATLTREDDRFEPSLGKTVRVYTVYGREAVFADDDDFVIGDLAGLRPSDTVEIPEPVPTPLFGEPDPVNTP